MATINGARAVRMQEMIGSLEVGKPSGMIGLDSYAPRKMPLVTSGQYIERQHNLMQAAQRRDVVMARVNGEVVVCRGQLLCDDLKESI